MKRFIKHIWAGILFMIVADEIIAQQNPFISALDSEMNQLRKELAQIQIERQKNRDDMKKDRNEADAYRIRTQKRFTQMHSEIDTIKMSIRNEKVKSDSLTALIDNEINSQKQVSMNQDLMRLKLVEAGENAQKGVVKFPPLVKKKFESSLLLLKSELTAKTIDNIEGVTRLFQILDQMYDVSSSIQVSQEASPSSDLHGIVYRLRIGGIFESAVDLKGEKSICWIGNDSAGIARWEFNDKIEFTSDLLKAAQIREGKSLPSFASFQFPETPVKGEVK